MTTTINRRPDNDAELCALQRAMVRHFGGETREVIEAVQAFSRNPSASLEFALRAYGITQQ